MHLNFVTEELINPTCNLLRAIFYSCGIALAVTFANAYYGLLAIIMPLPGFGMVNGVMLTSLVAVLRRRPQ
ncbi:hypothetical protein M3Y99_02004900 [Aphelenchoides fujianensis]|nr:hypothetical protein M3Y99_02004900 [Aphelenchoides fujianensis]